ncbi:ATP-dependent helicase [Bifidobacterium sp. 64T4]|uniref:ATP-dependent DNA helicase n=1 Tax=Bifidobacterium pongonis TaxID=2834432 RepID=UPI001C59D527|nr:ATP-dependent DNA helicase [Bifidobacterium pongonis]MBW3094329.1 ATP-dependent helicase [Bifidobacterium pongonis]
MSTFTDSPEQAKVINAPVGDNVLVVAGAGSGKTYTMTRRIVSLIEHGVAPERILGLTFTRKAAGELLSRVSAAVIGEGKGDADRMFLKPAVFTYDAFFQSIVRQYGLLVGFDQNTQPLSEAGARQLAANTVEQHMDSLRGQGFESFSNATTSVLELSDAIASSMIGGDVTDMHTAIARVREWDDAFIERTRRLIEGENIPENAIKLKPPKRTKKDTDDIWERKLEEFQQAAHDACVYTCASLADTAERRNLLLDLVEAYDAEKRRLNMAEFSDFTIAAYQLVTRFPSIGARYRNRFSHVLLDEYQDTSTTQAALIATLFNGDGTVVSAVGDPFQSIYAWRGASPGAFRMFQQDFHMPAEYKPYSLSVTRRNSKLVLEAANNLTMLLRNAPSRPGSSPMREVDVNELEPLETAPAGTVGVLGYDTLGQEIDGVARFCREAIERNTRTSDGHKGSVAILFRAKNLMPLFQQALEQCGLSCVTVGYSAMLERPEVRDMFALLRVACDHSDSKSLMRLLATPRFGLGSKTLTALAGIANGLNLETQYRALAAAGLVPIDEPRENWDALVRQHRDKVGSSVFLADLLLRDDLDEQLAQCDGIDDTDARIILRAGGLLHAVCGAVGRPLPDVVRAAVQALELDVDTVVAQGMRGNMDVNPTIARIPMEAVIDLVDTYTSEISAGQTPTVRGFMAWVDDLRSIEDETSTLNVSGEADVELMTIHQSKGLEWDAVAVVGLEEGKFPSKQGDLLKISPDERHEGGWEDGVWRAPEYQENARSWLSNSGAVPAPVRADAGILPRFPHDAPVDADPIASLELLDAPETVDDEAFGTLRAFDDETNSIDPDTLYLTQSEEYGRRYHADERRLAYVALTRARTDLLLTYSQTGVESRDPRAAGNARKNKPSVFWQEVRESLRVHNDIADTPSNLPDVDELDIPLPDGYFVGDHAREYEDAVVGQAWLDEPEANDDEGAGFAWPAHLSDDIATRLRLGADQVRRAIAAAERGETDVDAGTGVLYNKARMLVSDGDLMTGALTGDALDTAVKRKAQRIMAGSRQSVTGLQAIAGGLNKRDEAKYWRGVIRPIPSVASPAASTGTRFHAWAERFMNALHPEESGESRDGMLDALRDGLASGTQDADTAAVLEWERRLAESPWAKRAPAWAERQIVVSVRDLGGQVVNGKLDAVFFGGFDPQDESKRFTIVDWKTGHRPYKREEVARKLIQLDLYRLLLAEVEGIPLESIDAELYYVSEADETRRELRAEAKSREDIIAELSVGIPDHSDDD